MTLIQTFPPHSDESGRGYYRRLSSANALSSWKELTRHVGDRCTFDALLTHPEPVGQMLGLDPAWTQHATAQDDRVRSWTGMRRHGRDAVCGHCLRESLHLRATWEHAYLVACPSHGVLMRDICPACNNPLRTGREHIEFCDCGFDLRASESEPASATQTWVSSLVAHGASAVQDCGPALHGVPAEVSAKLINILCKQPDPTIDARRWNASAPSTMLELVAFLHPLEELLSNWPSNFKAHVSERLRAGPVNARTLNSRLGTWYQQLRKLAEHEASHPFLSAVGQVAESEFDGVIGLDTAAAVITKEATHVLLLEAAKRIGISHNALTQHRVNGNLPCKEIKSGTNGRVYQVAVAEVDAIIHARSMWTTEKDACAKLGVPPAVLDHLSDAGAIQCDARWSKDLRKGGPISIASVTQFIEQLRRSASAPRSDGRRVVLRELSARHVGDKKALASALQAIAAGHIGAVKAEGLVGNYEFEWDQVAQHYARPLLDQGLSIQALSEATGYKHESISCWVWHGLLKSRDILLRGQPSRIVTPTQFAEFRRQYVPLSDLAKALNTKSSALVRQLGDIELVGYQVLTGGERRGGLVRMEDLARAALKHSVRP